MIKFTNIYFLDEKYSRSVESLGGFWARTKIPVP